MTFQEYIAQRHARADDKGDFIRLVRSGGLPDAQTWTEIRTYLEAKGLSPTVISAGQELWADYHKHIRNSRTA